MGMTECDWEKNHDVRGETQWWGDSYQTYGTGLQLCPLYLTWKKQNKKKTPHLTTVLQAITLFVTVSSRALQLEMNDNSSSFSPSYPYSSLVAVDTGDGQPGGQIQHVLQHFLIQLQVGQLTLSLQCAQVDLIWGEVLSEPTQDENKHWLVKWFKSYKSIVFMINKRKNCLTKFLELVSAS